jgi:hypothetical protein
VRHNTVIDSPGGRIDIRAGIGSTLESNWQEDGGSDVHGGNHRVIGNYMRGGSGINLMSGDHDWNYGASSSHNRAYNVFVAGNDTNALIVGKSFYAAMEAYPALDNIIEAHSGSTPTLKVEQDTAINAATNVSFSPPFKLMTSEVGPTAISQASAAYLQCRRP